MGTISEKLTYLEETKELIKQAIVDKGVEVNDTDTFRSYADKISEIEGGGGGGNLFSSIGYPSTPDFIVEGIAYAEEIQNTWQSNYIAVKERLVFFPLVDTSDWYNKFTNCNKLLYVPAIDVSNRPNIGSLFDGCASLTVVDCGNWDVSKNTTFMNTFNKCTSLSTLDVSNWDVSKCTSFNNTFNGCSSLTSLDVSNWDTSNVTDMRQMFNGCSSLTSLDVSNWDTSKVIKMNYLFSEAKKLTSLDVSKWVTSSATDMTNLFYHCDKLTSLDVSNWDVSNVTIFDSMFMYATGLTTLDISNWDTSKATNVGNWFNNAEALEQLNMGNITMTNVTSGYNIFIYLKQLRDFIWNNLGDGAKVNTISFSSSKNLGVNDDTYTNAKQHLTDTFVTNSYDRASAGYSACKLSFHSNTKALFTEEEIAAMTAKGYTIA